MSTKLAFAAVLLSLGAVSAQALPAAPVQTGFDGSDVTLVADGCGPGYFRNDFGRCRPMRRGGGGGVVVVPPVVPFVVAPVVRGCPPGMWRHRSGRCVY
jgi:hypothetical protein